MSCVRLEMGGGRREGISVREGACGVGNRLYCSTYRFRSKTQRECIVLGQKYFSWGKNPQKSQKLLSAKRNAQETFLRSLLQNEGKSWAEFYRYIKRHKGNRKNIPMIRDSNGGHIRDPVEKANNLNNSYASVFCYDRDIVEIKTSHVYETFTIKTSIIKKRLAMIRRNKSVGTDDIPGDILKMGGEAMIS